MDPKHNADSTFEAIDVHSSGLHITLW